MTFLIGLIVGFFVGLILAALLGMAGAASRDEAYRAELARLKKEPTP